MREIMMWQAEQKINCCAAEIEEFHKLLGQEIKEFPKRLQQDRE